MQKVAWHQVPVHGLNIEPTLVAGDLAGAAALTRYWWARDICTKIKVNRPARVWDLGCGCGYGSRIMAEGLDNRITAVDMSKPALQAIRGDYGSHSQIDVVDQPLDWYKTAKADWGVLEAGSMPIPDMIVAFELFEALRHRDIFLDKVKESQSGVFLLNAAHHKRVVTTVNPENAAVHYAAGDLHRLLKRYFTNVFFSDEHKGKRTGPFAFITNVNHYIRQAGITHPGGEPFEVGNDLILAGDDDTLFKSE